MDPKRPGDWCGWWELALGCERSDGLSGSDAHKSLKAGRGGLVQDQQVADASGRRLGNAIAVNSLCIGRSSGSQRIGSNEAEAGWADGGGGEGVVGVGVQRGLLACYSDMRRSNAGFWKLSPQSFESGSMARCQQPAVHSAHAARSRPTAADGRLSGAFRGRVGELCGVGRCVSGLGCWQW